jgi:hypothetical protein
MGRVETRLDEVLSLWLSDERLELRGCKGVNESSFGDHEQEDLCPSESGKLVSLGGDEVSKRG